MIATLTIKSNMKKILLAIFLLFFFSVVVNAQAKKVLLEEFTGAHCSQCPLGVYYTDSMLTLHPDLIAVALHSYPISDAMDFAEIDTLFDTYSQGAPLGAIDRICSGSSSNLTAVFVNQWNGNISQRLSMPADLTLSITPSWISATRNITAQVSINIVSNMSAGDYRLSLYVVEDSVTGTGSGYDQLNIYDTDASSPFYGMGNPIVGFIHRHVARALLPSSWGLQGLILSSPTIGQNFYHTFNYTLPVSYNENRVHLVAFVYKFTSNHTGDEVLNVTEEQLLQSPSSVLNSEFAGDELQVYPNPLSEQVVLEFAHDVTNAAFILYDVYGKAKKTIENISGSRMVIHRENMTSGIYFYKVVDEKKKNYNGKLVVN